MMHTKVIDLRSLNKDEYEEALIYAGNVIKQGGLVAFPTETVYGLGANALDEKAVGRIFEAKGRPSDNPLIVHVCDILMAEQIAGEINPYARRLMEAFFPGSLTVVVPKRDFVPQTVTGGLDTVGLRCPESKFARDLIRHAGIGIAAPSANISGKPSPTNARHVFDDLDGKIDMILNGGDCEIGLESTVIDATVFPPVILRPGKVTIDEIRNYIPETIYDPGISGDGQREAPKSPGMKYKHYAPDAKVYVVEGAPEKVKGKIDDLLVLSKKNAVISINGFDYFAELVYQIKGGQQEFAKSMFSILRECDQAGVETVFVEAPPADGLGFAIANRLYKAAGYNVIQA